MQIGRWPLFGAFLKGKPYLALEQQASNSRIEEKEEEEEERVLAGRAGVCLCVCVCVKRSTWKAGTPRWQG